MPPELNNRRVLVVGLGRTGIALVRFLVKCGARVSVTDRAPESDLGALPAECRSLGVSLELGGHRESAFRSTELIIVSPGVPHTIPELAAAEGAGVPVMGEMELAACLVKEPIAAVTGTNGKTTTTALLGEMLRRSGKRVFVGGNIGNPLIEHVDSARSVDVVVLEVSSFQLDTARTFHPGVGVLLNVTPDHLDRYPDLAAYARAKGKLFENQKAGDTAVLNGGDALVRSVTGGIRSRKLYFTGKRGDESGAVISGERISIRDPTGECEKMQGAGRMEFDLSGTYFSGRYGRENAAAACLAALAAEGNAEGIREALKTFRGLPHRLETVAYRNGIRFVNDSKATNVYSVLCALEAFQDPLTLILGGRDKGSDFRLLAEPIRQRVRRVILLGESADRIREAFQGVVSMTTAETMEAAVRTAFQEAAFGEVVLLSPACASFDMFTDYVHRGEVFRKAVEALP